ncbi:2Fe-2S iron-sulfur cluster-binding protein [Burkholderia sp. LMG 21824]|uniref:2Fe-2S iron-sulfur cluster-binding protein n=2 Tax=unclassified Burkholderia TaxID=2613784 RepID=UPI003C2B4A45
MHRNESSVCWDKNANGGGRAFHTLRAPGSLLRSQVTAVRMDTEDEAMHRLTLLPQGIEVWLPDRAALTELDFELHGQESIPFGCRAGACGACVIEVLDGLPNLGSRQGEETAFLRTLGYPDERFRLACQCRLTGAATVQVATPDG